MMEVSYWVQPLAAWKDHFSITRRGRTRTFDQPRRRLVLQVVALIRRNGWQFEHNSVGWTARPAQTEAA